MKRHGFRISDFGFRIAESSDAIARHRPTKAMQQVSCVALTSTHSALRIIPRRGLAPLELVLSLLFLLVLMALIINFGTTAPWHVRGNVAARHAVWRTLSARTGNGYPSPSNWWPPATMGLAPGRPFTTVMNDGVGPLWNQGDLTQPALRRPVVVDP